MRRYLSLWGAGCLAVALSWHARAQEPAPAPLWPGASIEQLTAQAPIHWVSVAQIEHSLAGKPPMAVGFDIDDTVLFSSAGFWRGKAQFSPGSNAYLDNPAFWEKMNNGWDAFSMPKAVAQALIAMHVRRGDSIWFVTGRTHTKTETVSQTLQSVFQIPDASMNPVVFAGEDVGRNAKTQWLKEKRMGIFYGDADGDIRAARAVGARGIRILRAGNSTNCPLPRAGSLGEEVVVNSEY